MGPPAGWCDPNDPYAVCWDPDCAPNCRGFVVAPTEVETYTAGTSVITYYPPGPQPTHTVVVTTTQGPPPTPAPQNYALLAIAIFGAAVIIAAAVVLTRRRTKESLTPTTT